MKMITKFNPKNLFRSKKSRSVSRSGPLFGSGSSSSSDGSINLKGSSGTPTSVLPSNSPFLETKSGDEICSEWSGFSSETHFELVQAFKLIDRDGDGKITKTELETVLRRVGAEPPSEEEFLMMFTEVDRDGDGCITLEEFGAISSAFGPANGLEELRDTFDCFDTDHDGKISAEELLRFFMEIGDERCTIDECRRMISGVDSDGDGFVCFEDFTRMMERRR
ncbi:EF-hand domain [Macleaya cordata]|uniref:EF-hand domain n=1 Tax=Macleaya cordata TaxID=56857 RepID=A0A200QTG7_MACCD|nr:EF-hand domain [Macleaya cordata]